MRSSSPLIRCLCPSVIARTMTTSVSVVREKYQELVKRRTEITAFAQIEALLSWDQTVNMPTNGNAHRSQQLATLSGVSHDLKTHALLAPLFEALKEKSSELNEREKAVVRDSLREYKQETVVPRDLATKIAKLGGDSYGTWIKAKTENNFALFKPFLQEWVSVSIQKAKLIDPSRPPYDVLMDQYERGLTSAKVDVIFGEIKRALVPLIEKVKQKQKPRTDFLQHEFDVNIQARVSRQITKDLGFDLERGRLDVSVHPFTTTIGATSDVRITSKYLPNKLSMGLIATIHETGHALYEQGLHPDYADLPGGGAVSMGIHESQSLFWERMVGLSEPFWNKYWDIIRDSFPAISRDATSFDFFKALNLVEPSKIRVGADELTYPLHIILRYEIEEALINGKIQVDDNLPKLWNLKMQEYLGVTIENDSEGILQDIHWASGCFGYFPTYTLGAIYASQFYKTAKAKIPNLEQQIGQGNFAELKSCNLNKILYIHVYGALYPTGDQLCQKVTGEELSASSFINYVTEKYSKLYSL